MAPACHLRDISALCMQPQGPPVLEVMALETHMLCDASFSKSGKSGIFFFPPVSASTDFCKLFTMLSLVFQMQNFARRLLYIYTIFNYDFYESEKTVSL